MVLMARKEIKIKSLIIFFKKNILQNISLGMIKKLLKKIFSINTKNLKLITKNKKIF